MSKEKHKIIIYQTSRTVYEVDKVDAEGNRRDYNEARLILMKALDVSSYRRPAPDGTKWLQWPWKGKDIKTDYGGGPDPIRDPLGIKRVEVGCNYVTTKKGAE